MKQGLQVAFGGAWVVLGCGYEAQAQVAADSSVTLSVQAVRQRYTAAIGSDSRLYNGPQYVNPATADIKGHPYFPSREAQTGHVHYDGGDYPRVALLYDCVQGVLVVTHPVNALQLCLVPDKVSCFELGGRTFVRLAADSLSEQGPGPGFYELRYHGRSGVELLVRRAKVLRQTNETRSITREFVSQDRYWLRHRGRYYSLTSKGTLFKALADRKKELNRFAQEQRLRFLADTREAAFLALVQQYDALAAASNAESR